MRAEKPTTLPDSNFCIRRSRLMRFRTLFLSVLWCGSEIQNSAAVGRVPRERLKRNIWSNDWVFSLISTATDRQPWYWIFDGNWFSTSCSRKGGETFRCGILVIELKWGIVGELNGLHNARVVAEAKKDFRDFGDVISFIKGRRWKSLPPRLPQSE